MAGSLDSPIQAHGRVHGRACKSLNVKKISSLCNTESTPRDVVLVKDVSRRIISASRPNQSSAFTSKRTYMHTLILSQHIPQFQNHKQPPEFVPKPFFLRFNRSHSASFRSHRSRQTGPSYQAANPPTCIGGAGSISSLCEDFGVSLGVQRLWF